jgi:two-component system, NarL family, invasion response regulator UvrY
MRLLIVDDHPMVIAGCRGMLAGQSDIDVVEARDGKQALDQYAREAPDIAILDVNLPDMSGYELLRRMLKRKPKARILVYTMNADPVHAARAIELGALGYMSKSEDPSLFIKAVRLVSEGKRYVSDEMAQKLAFFNQKNEINPFLDLTPREADMLRLLAEGKALAEIAHDLGICYKSAANSCSLLNRKLGARSRADLIRIAVEARAEKKSL